MIHNKYFVAPRGNDRITIKQTKLKNKKGYHTILIFTLFALAVGVSGCSPVSMPESPSITNNAKTGNTTLSPDANIPSASSTVAMNKQGNSNGIKLTVTQVTAANSLYYTESAKTIKPPNGGKFILVKTTGINDSKEGIDLSCALPVQTNVYDTQSREFSGVNDIDLYELQGNPGCNDEIQPGFPFNMTWVYVVPTNATVNVFQWNSLTSDISEEGPIVQVPIKVS